MDLPLDLLGQLGPSGLLAGYIVSQMTGRLISRTVHLDRVNDLKAAIAALEATVAERERQIGILMGRPRDPS
ncbi:MAG TPA: hypothetical protein VF516_00240 [Kofleriaceae bacterium]